jgi:glutaryl-CoA dehydrogenase
MSDRKTLNDFLNWDHLFSDEEKAARDTVRDWVVRRYLPVLTNAHRKGIFPREMIPEVAELGLFGANIQGYGCAGMNNVTYGLVLQELERADSGLRSLASVQGSLVMYPILAYGNEQQRKKWLPELAKGKMIGCFGLTEPSAGSDPASMKTTARKDGSHYVLDGMKAWITNSPIADLAVVWAKVVDEDNRIRGFVVERGTKGFETPDIEGKWSLRASNTGEIHLTDCRVPAANLLPESGGLKSPLGCLTHARFGIAFAITGAAIDCFECALDYGVQRIAFNKPIAAFQLYQEKLAEMATKIVNSQLLALHFGRLKDSPKGLTPDQVSMVKRHNVRAAREVASDARSMLGGIGITDAYPVIRHLMNIESVYTYEGTHEVHTLAIGRALTGINAFS